MKVPDICLTGMLIASLVFLICPALAAADAGQTVIYQTSFSSDPHWTTNNPTSDYWDPQRAMYHFNIEPSTGNYAYSPAIEFEDGSFGFEYDLMLERVDEEATFRLGFSGKDMDRSKGPNVITEFTNAKYGNIFWLRVVTTGAKLTEVNSHSSSYGGPTVKYDINTTYHVIVNYDDETKTVTERVTELQSGRTVWSYYLNTYEPLKYMNRIYIGSIGDYSMMNRYATGYIDNVKVYTLGAVTPAPTDTQSSVTPAPTFTKRPTTKATTAPPLTPIPTNTPASPSSVIVTLGALAATCACAGLYAMRKNR